MAKCDANHGPKMRPVCTICFVLVAAGMDQLDIILIPRLSLYKFRFNLVIAIDSASVEHAAIPPPMSISYWWTLSIQCDKVLR